jgi:hypothetical protein
MGIALCEYHRTHRGFCTTGAVFDKRNSLNRSSSTGTSLGYPPEAELGCKGKAPKPEIYGLASYVLHRYL